MLDLWGTEETTTHMIKRQLGTNERCKHDFQEALICIDIVPLIWALTMYCVNAYVADTYIYIARDYTLFKKVVCRDQQVIGWKQNI